MKITYIEEPLLQFGSGSHVCPKGGINTYSPYDYFHEDRPEKIRLGLIGIGESTDKINHWVDRCRHNISSEKDKLKNLFLSFPGFNENTAFKARIVCPEGYIRKIRNSSFNSVLSIGNLSERLNELVELFLTEIEFLSQNKKPDVILCILPEESISVIWESAKKTHKVKKKVTSEEMEVLGIGKEKEQVQLEQNFRRALKAKTMQHNIPIQIVRDRIVEPKRDMQDPATIAWNFFSALYYKAGGIPWALERKVENISCYAGISFYRSRDRKTTETSVAQIFNELGKGVILRGEPIQINKKSKTPHLTIEQANTLLSQALNEYKKAIKTMPQRLVLHKTSNFNDDELLGFRSAADSFGIDMLDLVTIQEFTPLRLYKDSSNSQAKEYPPSRGTMLSLDDKNHLLYTRGYIPHYETYPGGYIPSPLLVKTFQAEESPKLICEEILKLTKLNTL
ncbi:MAG: argonaute/piwi family protein [Aureispira sp.]